MALILNIETATRICSVALAKDGNVIAMQESALGNNHSSSLTPFIKDVLYKTKTNIDCLDAVAVSMGPGSYTGLRIGVSTAKGICLSINKPLISISTLKAMAKCIAPLYDSAVLFCPMIDARRMEVYSGIYDSQNNIIRDVQADIIDENSYTEYTNDRNMIIFGDGASKCKSVLNRKGIIYDDNFLISASCLANLAEDKYEIQEFENLAYFEPYYLKDFIATIPKNKIINPSQYNNTY
ncbi:MAG: tRNA (adenosine(37)-N6)-threonylcarbamoyltransferase complex dimerization subunit type 1 TsaB [Bacteroidota bacterium]|nr:tRNA (adenosine(37)-N6)-threonylcarbamoyltransferase complex dimerization subunit type 1 TsaB [Bacteroidota bacterium]